MIRNTAGQSTLIGPLELISDGTAVISGAAISTRIGGVTAAGSGTLTHISAGVWEYTPAQAETDTPALGLVLSATGARAVPLTIETTRLPVQTAPGSANGLPVLDGTAHLLAYSVAQPVTVSGTVDANIVAIENDTDAAHHLWEDETNDPPTIPTATQVADAVLTRDWTAITATVPARCSLNALRWLRNAWAIASGVLTVKKEDDSTTAWSKPVTEDASADPVTGAGVG